MRKDHRMTPLEIVNTFMAAASKRDYDTALPLLADDVEYQNMPLPAVAGPAAVKETIEMLLGMCSDSEWVVHRQVADGELVMNERTDRFLVEGRWLELPVAGVFAVRDGHIALWRDYFDLDTIMKQMAPPAE
jgi:limonene-1,2-epoxide hydrolase